jgi:mannose/fructose/N-acetylgalactosamine-specific phosphotransferase system component IIC
VSVWASTAAGAGAISLLELDAASIGPFLLSRPFVVGPLVGWLCGDPMTGSVLGGVFEALTLEELPLGGRLDFSAPVAAGAAAWLAAGPAALPGEAAFLAGLAAGWAHARLERRLRRGRGSHARRVEADLGAGRSPSLGAELAASLSAQAAATFVLAFSALAAFGPALSRLWPSLPEFLRAGARTAFLAAPWIGAGSLAASLLRRAS